MDMQNKWIMLTFVLVLGTFTAFVLLLLYKICGRCGEKLGLSEIDILSSLRDAKAFPVDFSNGWKLHDYVHGQPIWSHKIQLCQQNYLMTSFACVSKVKGSPQMVLNILKDARKYEQWTLNPSPLVSDNSILTEFFTNFCKQPANSVSHDVIGFEVKENPASSADRLLNKLRCLISSKPPSVKVAVVLRYWHKEENGCCWILEFDSESVDWTFCLMQPIEGWFETDRCMLTIVSCFGKFQRAGYERMAIKLLSVRNHLQHKRVQSIPLVRLSLNYYENEGMCGDRSLNLSVPDESKSKESRSKESKPTTKEPNKEVSLLQKFKNMIEVKKEWYEAEKRRKASIASTLASASASASLSSTKTELNPSTVSIQNPLDILRKLSPSKNMDMVREKSEKEESKNKKKKEKQEQQPLEKTFEAKILGKLDEFSNEIDSNKHRFTLRKRVPRLNDIGKSKTVSRERNDYKDLEINEVSTEQDLESKKVEGIHEETVGVSNFQSPEEVLSKSSADEMECQLILMADVTVEEILMEKARVSQVNITSSYKEQAESTGGWVYCGLEKDTVILRKSSEETGHELSYFGKGMVSCSPQFVFDIISKPQTRKFYDGLLKKVEVLHEFPSGIKIVYLYYEGLQSSKKLCHDLCLLQSEKIEAKKFLITLQSVDWPKCKELENVSRIKMMSSGWIIEPAIKENRLCSMVTYITQMEFGSGQRNTISMDEFAVKQPLCIISLRQHMAGIKAEPIPAENVSHLSQPSS